MWVLGFQRASLTGESGRLKLESVISTKALSPCAQSSLITRPVRTDACHTQITTVALVMDLTTTISSYINWWRINGASRWNASLLDGCAWLIQGEMVSSLGFGWRPNDVAPSLGLRLHLEPTVGFLSFSFRERLRPPCKWRGPNQQQTAVTQDPPEWGHGRPPYMPPTVNLSLQRYGRLGLVITCFQC